MSNLYSATRHLRPVHTPPDIDEEPFDDLDDAIPADVDECIDEMVTRDWPGEWRRLHVRRLGPNLDGAA